MTDHINSLYKITLSMLLKAYSWQGNKTHLIEAAPYFSEINSINSLCEVMMNLGYKHKKLNCAISEIDERLIPNLFVTSDNQIYVLAGKKGNVITAFNSSKNKMEVLNINNLNTKVIKGTLYSFKPAQKKQQIDKIQSISSLLKKYKRLIYPALGFSFILNLTTLSLPLFIMLIYNKVIAAASINLLYELLIGIAIIGISASFLMQIRAKILAIISNKLNVDIGSKIFHKLLYLPIHFTESAKISSQIARLKDFIRIRELFSNTLLGTLFDLPFIVISIAIIALLSSWLAIIPVVTILVLSIVAALFINLLRQTMRSAGQTGDFYESFLVETVQNLRAIKYTSLESIWQKRSEQLLAKNILNNLKLKMLNSYLATFSYACMLLSGLAILAFGSKMVIDGNLNIGALIASMILVWRILAPIRNLFDILPKLQQLISSSQQINRLLSMPDEQQDYDKNDLLHFDKFTGKIDFSGISLRYPNAYEPSLYNISFNLQPGEHLGIVGPNTSGKSTILKLLLNLYSPQVGKICIDDYNIQQINPQFLRQNIAYLPQQAELFHGTIASNLRLNNASATDEDLIIAAKNAGVLDQIKKLPDGFDTWLKDNSFQHLSADFIQRLCLARTMVKPTKIILLDEPASNLDEQGDKTVLELIGRLKNKTTLVMVSHRPSHLKLMDKILVLNHGKLVMYGPAQAILEKLNKELL